MYALIRQDTVTNKSVHITNDTIFILKETFPLCCVLLVDKFRDDLQRDKVKLTAVCFDHTIWNIFQEL